jgi:hypothetical protein
MSGGIFLLGGCESVDPKPQLYTPPFLQGGDMFQFGQDCHWGPNSADSTIVQYVTWLAEKSEKKT